jgi:hypothetical protein
VKPRNLKASLPTAVVYDRRTAELLIERRYRKTGPRCLAVLFSLLFLFSLSLFAVPKKKTPPPVDPTIVYNTTVKVFRGGTCEVPLRAISPHGYDVEFEIVSEPVGGSLSDQQRNSKSSVSYFYTHNGRKGDAKIFFRFKSKSSPQKAWGYAEATILVEEPPARFAADIAMLDFDAVFLGESRTMPIRIKNAGGGLLQGHLKVLAPWAIKGSTELSLAEGKSQEVLVTFAPLSTDTQRGSLIFESARKPFPEISLQGVGESRFEVLEKDSFEQRVGASELCIPIKNRTASPLSINVQCPLPLKAPATVQLPPESSGDLVLTLPAVPFAEKSVLITLGDGSAARDIRIQLPPPPSRLEWERDGKAQLGEVTPGRTILLTAKLQNTGSGNARAVVRTTGDGFTLAPGHENAFDIPPGEHVIVQAEWKFSDKPRVAHAELVAETEGLPPVQLAWQAEVQHPPVELAPSPSPSPTPGASPSPSPPVVLTAAEAEALRKRLPRDFSYRLVPELHWTAFFPARRTATAIVSWNYKGPEPVEFIIQREVQQRKGFFDLRVQVPDELPSKSLEPVWTSLEPDDVKIQKLPDGRWQARISSMSLGYHKVRIIAKLTDPKCMDGVDFSFPVGNIPLPQPLPWALPCLLALCSTYLLRNKIRSLFG